MTFHVISDVDKFSTAASNGVKVEEKIAPTPRTHPIGGVREVSHPKPTTPLVQHHAKFGRYRSNCMSIWSPECFSQEFLAPHNRCFLLHSVTK